MVDNEYGCSRKVLSELFEDKLLWEMLVEEIGEFSYDVIEQTDLTWAEIAPEIEARVRKWACFGGPEESDNGSN